MRSELKYVHIVKRNGQRYAYYRRDGQRQRIEGIPHSPKFLASYARIHASFEEKPKIHQGGFHQLCEEYLRSQDFLGLKDGTRQEYRLDIDKLRVVFGPMEIYEIDRSLLKEYMGSLSTRKGTANNHLRMIKKLFNYAVEVDYLKASPANGIKPYKGGTHLPWSDEEVASFMDAKDTSNEPKHVMAFALYTGQRQGDLIDMKWSHINNGRIKIVQQKTGVELWVPIHPTLQQIINIMPKDNIHVLTTATNKKWSASNLKLKFKAASRSAGIPENKVFHGLRKTATVKLIEAGCTFDEVKAITGHKTSSMVELYARGTNQERLATQAMLKLVESVKL